MPCLSQSYSKVVEYNVAVYSPPDHTATYQISIGWTPPPNNYYMLNSDGFCLGNPSKVGIGGVIQNTLGGWVLRFAKSF